MGPAAPRTVAECATEEPFPFCSHHGDDDLLVLDILYPLQDGPIQDQDRGARKGWTSPKFKSDLSGRYESVHGA